MKFVAFDMLLVIAMMTMASALMVNFQMLTSPLLSLQIFCTPKDHRKSKPFFDHVFVFSIIDNHIWFRNYQVSFVICKIILDLLRYLMTISCYMACIISYPGMCDCVCLVFGHVWLCNFYIQKTLWLKISERCYNGLNPAPEIWYRR